MILDHMDSSPPKKTTNQKKELHDHFCKLPDVLFSDVPSPPKKKRSDHESKKSGFRFDLKNPLEA